MKAHKTCVSNCLLEAALTKDVNLPLGTRTQRGERYTYYGANARALFGVVVNALLAELGGREEVQVPFQMSYRTKHKVVWIPHEFHLGGRRIYIYTIYRSFYILCLGEDYRNHLPKLSERM